MDEGKISKEGKKKGRDIIEAFNTQKIFVYDPENEYFRVDTEGKVAGGEDAECYFRTESRECILCLDDFIQEDVLVKLNIWDHVFHADCQEENMFYHNDCSYCRAGPLCMNI